MGNEIEKLFLSKFKKVYSEGVDRFWWLDVDKYVRLAAKYDLKGARLRMAIECVEEDESKIPSAKTIDRVLGFYSGEKEGKGNKSVTIDTVKALGKALCDGDEYGLLIKIEPSNVLMIIKQAEELWGTSDLNHIYSLLSSLIYELEASSYYSFKPGTLEDGFEYYDMRLQSIRHEIDSRFWNKKDIRNKLYRLVEETEELIKRCSRPGTPERWLKANYKLRYYDCVFDFIEACPELYKSIKNGDMGMCQGQIISFSFYPTEQECIDRKCYFAELITKNVKQNSKYSEERFYQNELVDAFRLVFESDFG